MKSIFVSLIGSFCAVFFLSCIHSPQENNVSSETVETSRSPSNRNCHRGFTMIAGHEFGNFCISTRSQSGQSWENAKENCRQMGAELCSPNDFRFACKKEAKNLNRIGQNSEWVDSGNAFLREVMGFSGCDSFSRTQSSFVTGYRCCHR